jgi:hypothetical protein
MQKILLFHKSGKVICCLYNIDPALWFLGIKKLSDICAILPVILEEFHYISVSVPDPDALTDGEWYPADGSIWGQGPHYRKIGL